MKEQGIVYVLTNPYMPGLVKIGMTERANIEARMKELYTSGTTVKHLKVNGIENYKLTIPPMEIQNRFDKLIMSGRKSKC